MTMPCIQKYPHGTSMASSNNADSRISVYSFNLLAPLYIRPTDQRTGEIQPFASFDWISDADSDRILGDECRLPKLLRIIRECASDFICVQELQLEREGKIREENCNPDGDFSAAQSSQFILPKWITSLIERSCSCDDNVPYGIVMPAQNQLEKIAERNRRVLLADVAITNAVFYRSDRWNPVHDGECGANNTTTCVTQAFLPANSVIGNGASEWDPIVISSIHLDARSEEKRVQQLQRCLDRSASFSSTPYFPPCIISGDFNCELSEGSCVNEFLTDEEHNLNHIAPPLPPRVKLDETHRSEKRIKECAAALRLPRGAIPSEEQLRDWDGLHNSVVKSVYDRLLTLRRIDTGCTRVAYDHDDDSSTVSIQNGKTMEQWKLDHIIYTPSTLLPLGRWTSLEDDEHSRKVGLPNDRVPTDHLPIAAMFERRTRPQLSDESKQILIESLNDIDDRQNLQLKAKAMEAERSRAKLEQQYRPEKSEHEPAETKAQPARKFKKKRSAPPMEIIQHIRSSRAMLKQLKAEQCAERRKFMSKRTILERMVLQHTFGGNITCALWIEDGRCDQNSQ